MTGAAQYLLAVYLLDRHRGDEPIATGAIAERIDRSNAATTEMVQQLESKGWVTYEPYQGASLTPDGRAQAEDLYETYVTLSRFFEEVLELEEHDKEAIELAGTVSNTVTNRLETTVLDDSAVGPESKLRSEPSPPGS